MVKNLPANAEHTGDAGWVPGLGSSPEEGNGNPCRYYCLGNPMDREAWWAEVFGVQRVRHDLAIKTATTDISLHICTTFSLSIPLLMDI